jgi:hypothetical protein
VVVAVGAVAAVGDKAAAVRKVVRAVVGAASAAAVKEVVAATASLAAS